MFTTKTYSNDFKVYEVMDNNYGSCIKIIPEKGGLISSFSINGEEILYLDKELLKAGGSIRAGGFPLLFPVCAGLTEGKYTLEGQPYEMKKHGFAWCSPWAVKEVKDGEIILSLCDTEETRNMYPFEFEVLLKYSLRGNEVHMYQEYINKSSNPMPVYAGFHPFFRVGDKDSLEFDINAEKYIDYTGEQEVQKEYKGTVDFNKPVDFAFILNNSESRLHQMIDKSKKRKLTVETSGEYKYLVVWTVQDKKFVCIEPWMAERDSMNTGRDVYMIAPGELLKTQLKLKVESI